MKAFKISKGEAVNTVCLPLAPAVFLGVQEGYPARGIPDVELWNLTRGIAGHVAGSTVSRQTLERAGFFVPVAPAAVGGVRPHPCGGWTIGRPCGRCGSALVYEGWWATRREAELAFGRISNFSGGKPEDQTKAGPAELTRCGLSPAGAVARELVEVAS